MKEKYVNIHQDLIDACRAGDRDAQFRIYKLYYKAMYNTSLRIVNDTAEAEDIMQESFLDAFRRIGSYTGEGSFGSWLKRIVVNRSLDHLRKTKEMVSLDEVGAEVPDSDDSYPEEEIRGRVEDVMRAIAQLPVDYRVIINLILVEGYDHEEVSCILNITNQLSRTRYSRARQRLLETIRANDLKKSFSIN